ATTLSRWEEAARHFEDALEMNTRLGARPFVARTQHAYARLLFARGWPGDVAKACELLRLAGETARALGMKRLQSAIVGFEAGVVNSETVAARGIASEPTPSAGRNGENVFRKDGEYWTIAYGGMLFRMMDSVGLDPLAP